MNPILRQCFKGIAYCYFHPEDKSKKELLNNLINQAWNLGYPRNYFDKPNQEIKVEEMTEWEIKYIFRQ